MNRLEKFLDELRLQNLAEGTIEGYRFELAKVPNIKAKRKAYLIAHKDNRMLIYAYRKWLKYQRKIGAISSEDLEAQLDTFRPPKRRGKTSNGKWIDRDEWEAVIRKAPSRCAKMGIWLGLQFGLRLGEIIHLRIEDIDLENQNVHIQARPGWKPKYNRNRDIPIAPSQKQILDRWIQERPKLDHPYLVYNSRNQQITHRTFQRWTNAVGLAAHDLRRSFAKVLYYDSKKDLKLVQKVLGHSNIATTSRYLELENEEIHERFTRAMG